VSTKPVDVPPPWFLARICALDAVEPGLAARTLRASKARRQVIAACLATATSERRAFKCADGAANGKDDEALRCFLDRVGDPSRLLVWRAKRLLEHIFEGNPPGFASAVEKTGPEIEKPAYYLRLHAVFTRPVHDAEARLLSRLTVLDATTLRLVRGLPSELIVPQLFHRLTIQDLKHLKLILPALEQVVPDAADESWKESLRELARHGKVSTFVKYWVKRASYLSPPIPGDDDVWPLSDTQMLLKAGRTFSNCLRGRVVDALQGNVYFYESRLLDTPTIAELERDVGAGSWKVSGISGVQNSYVPDDVSEAVEDWFKSRGVIKDRRRGGHWWRLEQFWDD